MKAAIIGAGEISAEHLKFLSASDQAQLVAVCDLSPITGQYAAERFGAPASFTDHRLMLKETQPQVVHVLTPATTHVQLSIDAMEAGAHVICEKPITLNHADFKKLRTHAERRDRRLIEDHNYRFNQAVLEIDRLVADGALGEVRDVEVRMALAIRSGGRFGDANLPHPAHQMPGGIIHDFITHLAYLTLRFVPGEVDRVAAAWSNHGGGDLFKYDDLDALVIADQIHARIRFSCHTAPDCFAITVRGTRGYAETDLFQPYLKVVVPRAGGSKLSPLVNQLVNGAELLGASVVNLKRKIMQQTPYEGLHTFLARTYEALRNGEEPPVTFDDMDRTVRLVDALLEEKQRI